jgi:hypothetical protein
MSDLVEVTQKSPRVAWNKGKLIGPKAPLKPRHVWSIRTRLQLEGRMGDLAMFNLPIDSKLRGCDVVAIKVEDVAHDYIRANDKKSGEHLFVGRRGGGQLHDNAPIRAPHQRGSLASVSTR